MKKIKFTLATLLVTAMLFASIPGMALAQEDMPPNQRGVLITKVAEILNINQQKLEDAFKQAQGELREGNLDARLNELVAKGTLTQQQVTAYKAWLKSRPDIPAVGPRQLKKLLDEGKITQEQANAFKAWLEAKPEMPKILPELLQQQAAKVKENRDALTTRVAQILGIDKQKLENAFKQAQGEIRGKALDARLQELVSKGTITQAQADAFKAWIKARPDIPPIGPAMPKAPGIKPQQPVR